MTETTLSMQMTVEWAKKWYNDFVEFSKSIMKKDLDFGVIPWVSKPSLLKPGAEKLRLVYGLWVLTDRVDEKMDIEKDFYDVTYKTTITDKAWVIIAQCEWSASTLEDKYRWRNVSYDKKPDNWDALVEQWRAKEVTVRDSRKTTYKPRKEEAERLKVEGKWYRKKEWEGFFRYEVVGTKTSYQVREEATNKIGNKNTLQKMAQKRSFVGAILSATWASEFYTQDVEDMVLGDVDTHTSVDTNTHDATASDVVPTEFDEEAFERLRQSKIDGKMMYTTYEQFATDPKVQKKYTFSPEREQKLYAFFAEGKTEGEILDEIIWSSPL